MNDRHHIYFILIILALSNDIINLDTNYCIPHILLYYSLIDCIFYLTISLSLYQYSIIMISSQYSIIISLIILNILNPPYFHIPIISSYFLFPSYNSHIHFHLLSIFHTYLINTPSHQSIINHISISNPSIILSYSKIHIPFIHSSPSLYSIYYYYLYYLSTSLSSINSLYLISYSIFYIPIISSICINFH
jgi:hypothetical protein